MSPAASVISYSKHMHLNFLIKYNDHFKSPHIILDVIAHKWIYVICRDSLAFHPAIFNAANTLTALASDKEASIDLH